MPALINAQHKLWTRDEVDRLANSGMVDLHQYELIEGELIKKVPKNVPHTRSIVLLMDWLLRIFGTGFVLQETPVYVTLADSPTSEPEPDVIVLNQSFLEMSSKPRSDQILLLIEVSASSLAMDSTTKSALYARAGIADYWILDVTGRRMIMHRDPVQGQYRSIVEYSETEFVAPLAAADARIRVADLF